MRECEKCVYHTDSCTRWNCQYEDLEMHDKRIKAETYDEIFEIVLKEENNVINFADKIQVMILQRKKELLRDNVE